MAHSPITGSTASDPFRTSRAFLMDQAGTYRAGSGKRHIFQLIASGAVEHGRLCPDSYAVEPLPSRWAMRLARTLHHPGQVPNGWHGRYELARGHEGSTFRLVQEALFCDAQRQRPPAGGAPRPMRITDVFDLIPGNSAHIRGVPRVVGQAQVGLRRDDGWALVAARSLGKIVKLGSVGSFAPERGGPFLLHAVLPREGLRAHEAGKLVQGAPRRLFLDAHGCETDEAVRTNGRLGTAKATIALPQDLTVSFLVPSGRVSLTETAPRKLPHPFVSLRRCGEEVTARFGSPLALDAARAGHPYPLTGTDEWTRVADLSLTKNGSITDDTLGFDGKGAALSAAEGLSHVNGNARPAIGAALHGVDWLTVRAGRSASLGRAVQLAQTLGYDELIVECCRPYRFDVDNGDIVGASYRPAENADLLLLPAHRRQP